MAAEVITIYQCSCGYRSLRPGKCRSHPYPARAMGPEMKPLVLMSQDFVMPTLNRLMHGQQRSNEADFRLCEITYGSYRDGHTCLDMQQLARDPTWKCSDEYREKILDESYPCARCQIRLLLQALAEHGGG